MANLNISFQYDLNTSLQVGDTLYYLNTETPHVLTDNEYDLNTSTGVFTENQGSGQSGNANPTQQYGYQTGLNELGPVVSIQGPLSDGSMVLNVVIDNLSTRPTTSSFFLFSKDNRANMSSLAGYYAEVTFTNTSNTFAEIYSVGSEIVESSK